jgi:hypothetical protein
MLKQDTIGTSGKKWQQIEKAQWLAQQSVKRSYSEEVLKPILALAGQFTLEQYGQLHYAQQSYVLMALKSKDWDPNKATVLVTGGVHGYETSGVHGALRFAATEGLKYAQQFNLLIVPCVSPWAYETINRWNPNAVDPNRSFYADSPATESASLMKLLASVEVLLHMDLHETTDTDNSEFRPALAARDAIESKEWAIPDGFYLVGDQDNPCAEFHASVIAAVQKVTHIAPADESNRLIGVPIEQHGVINYPLQSLGLCAGLTNARYACTTEVYPDSPKVDPENCILAQVAAVTAAIDFVITQG